VIWRECLADRRVIVKVGVSLWSLAGEAAEAAAEVTRRAIDLAHALIG
jgi:hypothetical protein